ncbi:MAG: BON domain-containing protein [Bryobacteraceae bacterium]
MKSILNAVPKLTLAGAMLAAPWLAMAQTTSAAGEQAAAAQTLARKVRHELVTLPFYGVFDNFAYKVEDGAVTLYGKVTRPTLRSSAENVVKRIEGVNHVVNNIEVLPLSPYDDRIRFAVLRAIYGAPGLDRYGLGAQPSIRILVRNGEVTLEGVVMNDADRNHANIRANGVSGVFRVTNNLRTDAELRRG